MSQKSDKHEQKILLQIRLGCHIIENELLGLEKKMKLKGLLILLRKEWRLDNKMLETKGIPVYV